MTRLITIQDQADWVSYIQNAAEYDFYHTWHYHHLDKSGSPFLFVYQEGDDFIAFPLTKRAIPGSPYYDLSCVYGFSGPISNKKMDELEDSLMENFKHSFLKFLADEKYVSVFSRMHPFFKQQILLDKLGGVHENGLTVAFDLSISIENQRKEYSQSTRADVNRARRKGFCLREEKGPEAVAVFVDIYTETMRRVSASNYYLFNETYFNKILNTAEYDARILMVYDGDTAMSSTIVTFTNGIMQAHLMGTRTQYLPHSPTKFLVDEMTLLGRSMGMRYYNLGGGLGFKEDNLFQWKSAFSKLHLPYKSWRYIANPTIYQQILDERNINKNADVDFFPLYRHCIATN